MKNTQLTPEQKQKAESLCEKVRRFSKGIYLDYDKIMAYAKEELAKDNIGLEFKGTEACFFSSTRIQNLDGNKPTVYVVYSKILEREKPEAHRYGLAYQSYLVLQCILEEKITDTDSLPAFHNEAHYFAKKTSHYQFAPWKISLYLPKYALTNLVRKHKERSGKQQPI